MSRARPEIRRGIAQAIPVDRRLEASIRAGAPHRGDERIGRAAPLDRRVPDERLRVFERHRRRQREGQRLGQRRTAIQTKVVAHPRCVDGQLAGHDGGMAGAAIRQRDHLRHHEPFELAIRASSARAPAPPRRGARRAARRWPARRRPSSRCRSDWLCAASCCCRRVRRPRIPGSRRLPSGRGASDPDPSCPGCPRPAPASLRIRRWRRAACARGPPGRGRARGPVPPVPSDRDRRAPQACRPPRRIGPPGAAA